MTCFRSKDDWVYIGRENELFRCWAIEEKEKFVFWMLFYDPLQSLAGKPTDSGELTF